MNDHDRRLIQKSIRAVAVERWGPYCTLNPVRDPENGGIRYVHVVYPVARGWIRNDDGTTRPATDEELDIVSRSMDAHLDESFEFPQW